MKNILLASVLVVMLCACSQQHKAEKMVKKYLKENLDDFKSYDPISFSDLQPIYLKDVIQEDIDRLTDEVDKFSVFNDSDDAQLQSIYTEACHRADSLKNVIDTVNGTIIDGWKIEHSYRASNKLGATEKYTEVFEFDKDMSEIW